MSEPERLVHALREARAECTRAEARVKIGGEAYNALERCRAAIDDLAGVVTGDREIFWTPASRGVNAR